MTWVYDENRNRASVERWGSEDEASGYKINPCRFYDTNDVALEHMRELAEKEAV